MPDLKELINQLTLEEKASLCSGMTFWKTQPIERLNIPSVTMTDGPHGLRREKEGSGLNVMQESLPATCFPTAVTTASSWDRNILKEVGIAIAEEAITQKVSTVLGPGTNIKRSPLCGRNFEYFSEDPYLSAEMSGSFVDGVQSKGVGTSLKHFCGNNQEHIRMSIDSIIDERTLREIYLPAFEMTVKHSQPHQIMCSYNKLNGTFSSDNKRLLTDILRTEWGFKGMVVSDWGAVNDRIEGVRAGLDLEMPTNNGMNNRKIVEAVNNGSLKVEELDNIVEHILDYVFKSAKNVNPDYKCDYAAHHKIAQKAVENSAVLLKNDDILPLKKEDKIAVIGKLAEQVRYQGSGSSKINPINVVNIITALNDKGADFEYAEGYVIKGDGYNKKLLEQAVNLAKTVDKVVVVIGLTDIYESEGFDRTGIDLPVGHNKLVIELIKANPNIVIVLQGGSPVSMPWQKDVKAILNTYLGGEAVGEATVSLLYGDVNPSGKLAETYPKKLEDDIGAEYFSMGPKTVEYRESVYVGYRYYDTAKKEVRFPFGFGLSYTNFEYSALKLSAKKLNEKETLSVTFTVKNTGKVFGAETAQVYVKDIKSTIFRPEKELKGFEKIFLKAGESKTVTVKLNSRAFSYYNTAISDWHVESGDFEILVGASSRDIKLSDTVTVISANPDAPIPDYTVAAPVYYNIANADAIPAEAFSALCGKELPDNIPSKRGEFTVNSTVTDISVVPLGKFIKKLLTFGGKLVSIGTENKDMIVKSIIDMPLRSFSGFSGGILSEMTVDGLVDMLNKTKGGGKKFWGGFRKKNK